MTTNKKDFAYQKLTNYFIDKIESGELDSWFKPWKQAGMKAGEQPRNYNSKNPYRGINRVIASVDSMQYSTPLYITFKAAIKMGATKVNKGGIPIALWKIAYVNPETGEYFSEERFKRMTTNERKGLKKFFSLRYYTVFNIDLIEGIDFTKPIKPEDEEKEPDFEPIEIAESIINNWEDKPNIVHRESKAYYRPGSDTINMPNPKLFVNPESYYHTLFHESIHSTGAVNRLARSGVVKRNGFGTQAYSKEELIAELGAAFLSSDTRIITDVIINNSASYMKNWLGALKDDCKFIVQAAQGAQKAADYIRS